jgi:hypothetical protein
VDHFGVVTGTRAGKFTEIALGNARTCAIYEEGGGIECWGAAEYGVHYATQGACDAACVGGTCSPEAGDYVCLLEFRPPTTGSYHSISAGFDRECAVDAESKVVCWGHPWTTPPSTEPVDSITVGYSTYCTPRGDGTHACVTEDSGNPTFSVPADDYLDVEAGLGLACALDVDGNVSCTGPNYGVAPIPQAVRCPSAPGPDTDGDGVRDLCDNCRAVMNAGQADGDGDYAGDACDVFAAVEAPAINPSGAGAGPMAVGDVDGDSKDDIVLATTEGNGIAYRSSLTDDDIIISSMFEDVVDIALADMNNDMDLDVVALLATGEIALFINPGNVASAWTGSVKEMLDGGTSLALGYMDDDTDIDIVAASREGDRIVWFENPHVGGGAATVVISDTFDGPSDLAVGDVDNDGDHDVVAVSAGGWDVYWWEHTEPNGTDMLEHTITEDQPDVGVVALGNFVGSARLEVAAASLRDGRLFLYAGQNSEWGGTLLGMPSAFPMAVGDVNGDERDDLVGCVFGVGWLLVSDGMGGFARHIVDRAFEGHCSAAAIANLDGVGRPELVFSERDSGEVRIWQHQE